MAETLLHYLEQNARVCPDEIAVREKRYGIWQEVSWKEYYQNVRATARGLNSLGFEGGSRLSIISKPTMEWLFVELGSQLAGGCSLGLFPSDENLDDICYLTNLSDTVLVFTEDQEQTDKILAVKKDTPGLRKVIVLKYNEVLHYNDPYLMDYKDLLMRGLELDRENPSICDRWLESIKPGDYAVFRRTSGTTGRPKIVIHTQASLVGVGKGLGEVDRLPPGKTYFSLIPMAHDYILSEVGAIVNRYPVAFAEEPETGERDFREIGVSAMLGVPSQWEKYLADIRIAIEDTGAFRRRLFNAAMKIGETYIDSKTSASLLLKVKYALADLVIYRKMRDHLGLSKVEFVYTGADSISSDVIRFFQILGIKLRQAYGSMEAPACCIVPRDVAKFHTVGKPIPGFEVKVENDEVLVGGGNLFYGYYKRPEETRKTIREGWYRTGDAGFFDDDGNLIVQDRLVHLQSTSEGRRFSPKFLENKLKFSPYIRQAVVIGNGMPYISALIQIDPRVVGNWAERRGLGFTTFQDLSQKKEVYNLITNEVKHINEDLPKELKIKAFTLLDKELDQNNQEITATLKIRREVIAERHADLISALYTKGMPVRVAVIQM